MKHFAHKLIAISASLAALSGCGFTPVYGTMGAGVGPVEVKLIEGRTGYFLGQALTRRAGLEQSNDAKRLLEVKLKQQFNNVSLRPDSFATRTRVTINAEYTLSPSATKPEIKGNVVSVVSFDSVQQAYSEVSLQADAEERAANDLADRIWTDIIGKSRRAKSQ